MHTLKYTALPCILVERNRDTALVIQRAVCRCESGFAGTSFRQADRQTDRPAGLPADCTWTQPPSRRRLRRLCSAPQTPARPSSRASILGLNLHALAAPTCSRFYGTPFIQKTSHPFANVIRILTTLFTIFSFARLFQRKKLALGWVLFSKSFLKTIRNKSLANFYSFFTNGMPILKENRWPGTKFRRFGAPYWLYHGNITAAPTTRV